MSLFVGVFLLLHNYPLFVHIDPIHLYLLIWIVADLFKDDIYPLITTRCFLLYYVLVLYEADSCLIKKDYVCFQKMKVC